MTQTFSFVLCLLLCFGTLHYASANDEVRHLREEQIRVQMVKFQASQEAFDSKGAAALFAEDGIARIPFGSGTETKGRASLEKNWAQFFDTLKTMTVKLTTPLLVNGHVGIYGKDFQVEKKTGCVLHYQIVNWFEFEQEWPFHERLPLIKIFSAVFNVDDSSRCVDSSNQTLYQEEAY
eukprot:GILK01006299.1.p1 GENE.GILK01006299.1~~GILK01006299.1.p1  ORF type:complete len:189 (+),score=18.92 GILK01006299.1:35-568(+)